MCYDGYVPGREVAGRMACGNELVRLFRLVRVGRGLTQDEVGEAVGITGNAYGKIENGRRGLSLDLLGPLCRFLGVSVAEAMSCLVQAPDGRHGASMGPGGAVGVGLASERPMVGFTEAEAAMHVALARFLEVDPLSPEAFGASGKVVQMKREMDAGRLAGDGARGKET